MPYVGMWFEAFLLTCLIEVPIAAYALRAFEPSAARRVALALFANLASHPAVWFVFPEVIHQRLPYLAIAETWAFASEAVFFFVAFRGASPLRAAAVSAIANATSFGVGLLIAPLLGF